MAEKTYPVLMNLEHDGKLYAPGGKKSTIVLDEDVAVTLPEGVLGEAIKPVRAEPPKT